MKEFIRVYSSHGVMGVLRYIIKNEIKDGKIKNTELLDGVEDIKPRELVKGEFDHSTYARDYSSTVHKEN